MKFLLALDNFSRRTGGAPASARELAQALLEAGHEVEVLESGGQPGHEGPKGCRIHNVPLPSYLVPPDRDLRTLFLNPLWRKRIARHIRATGPDMVITQGMFAPGTIQAAKEAGVPVAYFFRGYAPFCPREFVNIDPTECSRPACLLCLTGQRWLSWPLSRRALALYGRTVPRADLLVANSQYVAGLAERFWQVRAEVAYPPLRLPVADAPQNDPAGYLLFIKPQKTKGLDLILDLARHMPERRFAIAGLTRGSAARSLTRLTNVQILGWVHDMPAVYRGARFLLGPSRWPEPFGRVFTEAAAVGCPTLAFHCGGIPEAIGDGAVLLHRAAGPEDWAAALRRLDDPEKYESLRLAALAHARKLVASNQPGHTLRLLEEYARKAAPARAAHPVLRKLDVVHVISALPLGGAELSLFHLATRLSRERFQTHVICTREEGALADRFRAAGVPVEFVRLPSRYSPLGLWSLTKAIQMFGSDIVHTHLRRANTSGRIAAWLARVPVIIAHERGLPTEKRWRHFLVDRLLARISSKVIAVSQDVADAEARGGGTPREKLLVMPNALDLATFRPGDRAAARSTLGIAADDFVVGFAGRLHAIKNLDVLLRAVAEAGGQAPNLRLALAGSGPEKGRLESLAAELGIAPRVLFLGVRQDMPAVYPAFDLLCLPSQAEGCSRVLLEAAACGLPLVATPVGYARELLGEDAAGILVPVGDHQAAARAILRLAREPETRSRMGRAARERAAAHDIDAYVRSMEQLYLQLWAESHTK
jgi:glycosyltransferase involved in cell wall biosynthesis